MMPQMYWVARCTACRRRQLLFGTGMRPGPPIIAENGELVLGSEYRFGSIEDHYRCQKCGEPCSVLGGAFSRRSPRVLLRLPPWRWSEDATLLW